MKLENIQFLNKGASMMAIISTRSVINEDAIVTGTKNVMLLKMLVEKSPQPVEFTTIANEIWQSDAGWKTQRSIDQCLHSIKKAVMPFGLELKRERGKSIAIIETEININEND